MNNFNHYNNGIYNLISLKKGDKIKFKSDNRIETIDKIIDGFRFFTKENQYSYHTEINQFEKI